MAMLHPDDERYWFHTELHDSQIESLFNQKCGTKPSAVFRPTDLSAAYHLVVFCEVALDARYPNTHSDVVLRVSRPCIPRIKTENEVTTIQHLERHSSIPVPKIHFWDSDDNNVLSHEYICMERILYPSLDKMFTKLSDLALDHILSQLVDFFIDIRRISPSSGRRMLGGLQFDNHTVLASLPDAAPVNEYIIPGPVVEETFWQTPDIARYWNTLSDAQLSEITFEDLNVRGPFACWVDWVLAWLQSYEMQIMKHPRLEFCRERIADPLHRIIEVLQSDEPVQWLRELKKNRGGRALYLSMKDLHGGNILVDDQGKIQAFIDWEFAGFVPSFAKESHPVEGIVIMAKHQLVPDTAPRALESWVQRFSQLFQARDPADHAAWLSEIDPASIGDKGNALHDLCRFLRSVIEVCVREEGNVQAGKGPWLDRVVEALSKLEE